MSHSKEIGERVRGCRGEASQTVFAEKLGVHRKTVERWESGDRIPDGESLLALKREFDIDPGWLLTGSGAAPALKPDEAALLDNYRHCSAEGKNAVKTTVSCLAQSQGVKKGKAA